MALPGTLSGFVLFPVVYAPQVTHIIYGKAHSGSSKKPSGSNDSGLLPVGRTLFVVNVPPDATDRELSLYFKPHGTVEKVVWDQTEVKEETLNEGDSDSEDEDEDADEGAGETPMDTGSAGASQTKRKKKVKKSEAPTVVPLPPPSAPLRTLRETGRTAYVVFLDASSLARALSPSSSSSSSSASTSNAPHKPRPWPRAPDAPRGLAHYAALHDARRPALDAVRAHADSAAAAFDYAEAERKRLLARAARYKKGEAVVDADGFTLVTRGTGAYGQTAGGGAAVASKLFEATGEASKRGKKKKKKEMDSFYKFQVHEKKRQDLINLKKRWEEDKAKVEKLKATRRFKPY